MLLLVLPLVPLYSSPRNGLLWCSCYDGSCLDHVRRLDCRSCARFALSGVCLAQNAAIKLAWVQQITINSAHLRLCEGFTFVYICTCLYMFVHVCTHSYSCWCDPVSLLSWCDLPAIAAHSVNRSSPAVPAAVTEINKAQISVTIYATFRSPCKERPP